MWDQFYGFVKHWQGKVWRINDQFAKFANVFHCQRFALYGNYMDGHGLSNKVGCEHMAVHFTRGALKGLKVRAASRVLYL